MKNNIIVIAFMIASLAFASAAEKVKAPNGGRIINQVQPHAEFLISPDKKVEIRFLGDEGKIITPTTQIVTLTMGDRSAPTKLTFTKDGNKFTSDKVIPTGEKLPVVLQIKITPDSKIISEKFNLDLSKCPECNLQEYACSCDHEDHNH
jgi:hypothetical protein